VQRADQRPNLQTQGNATRQRTPAYLNATSASQVQAVVGLAAFEVDLSERFTGGQRSWSFTPQISFCRALTQAVTAPTSTWPRCSRF
jgi:hypothetical protein